jgi:N-acetylglucosaminyl-diphospho-decaprenol L-rhamnosyltransferase
MSEHSSSANVRESLPKPGGTLPAANDARRAGFPRFDLDVGIIYTYERDLMSRLVASLERSVGRFATRLILVDNDSADGVEAWKTSFPGTQVVHNPERLLYCANLNRILEVSTARYVLLLNTDLYFDPEEACIAKMVEFMESHPRCGIAGCRLYHEDGQYAYPARRFQTIPVILARRLGLGRVFPHALDDYLYHDQPARAAWNCDWLSGCFLMLRRQAVEDVGLFDARFVKYFEDVDMCLRMARAGWQVMFNGGTYCYHLEQRASKKLLSADAWRHARSYLRWLRKWGFSPEAVPPRPAPRRRAA